MVRLARLLRPFIFGCLLLSSPVMSAPVAEGVDKRPLQYNPSGVPARKVGWADNIQVLASVGENWDSYAGRNGSYYTQALLALAAQPSVSGIVEAHYMLQKSGYWSVYAVDQTEQIQYPVSTVRMLPGAWVKNQPERLRFALLLGQQDDSPGIHARRLNAAILKDLDRMRAFLEDKRQYGLEGDHIKMYPAASKEEIRAGIERLADLKKRHPDQPIDILIYYSGHGKRLTAEPFNGIEGVSPGLLEGPGISKKALQHLVNRQLGDSNLNVLMIYDMCNSGLMIASANR